MKRVIGFWLVIGAVAVALWLGFCRWQSGRWAKQWRSTGREAADNGYYEVAEVYHESADEAAQRARDIGRHLKARAEALRREGHPGAAAILDRLNRHAH
jgi:nucleotide-binding universal stress UspA family protein